MENPSTAEKIDNSTSPCRRREELFCCWMWGYACLLVFTSTGPASRLRRQPVGASQLVLTRINVHIAGVQVTNHGSEFHKVR